MSHAETLISFDHDDGDAYRLVWEDEDGERQALTFGTFEAVRLYELAVRTMGCYVDEMKAAQASYARGDGPNGEPRGTWEDDRDEGYDVTDPKHSRYLENAVDLADQVRKPT